MQQYSYLRTRRIFLHKRHRQGTWDTPSDRLWHIPTIRITRLGKLPRGRTNENSTQEKTTTKNKELISTRQTQQTPKEKTKSSLTVHNAMPEWTFSHWPVRCILVSVQQKAVVLKAAAKIRRAHSDNYDSTKIFRSNCTWKAWWPGTEEKIKEQRDASLEKKKKKDYAIRGQKIVPQTTEESV